ncbi:hypothetical protein B277_13714 [Janibacter hoylei PVAS-1]|uniref:Uncharacterized protein n=1 Tax=Janibacter hoylei PVAS-1 TaxID=1210046 RepID=K1E4E0_9MICO|nr:hypothetical protein B277_13714 [Janibacter hoylei PVAS-1]RWU83844.1 hypothetical protein CWN80_08995 [Janibacter hoylei PVAS-1]
MWAHALDDFVELVALGEPRPPVLAGVADRLPGHETELELQAVDPVRSASLASGSQEAEESYVDEETVQRIAVVDNVLRRVQAASRCMSSPVRGSAPNQSRIVLRSVRSRDRLMPDAAARLRLKTRSGWSERSSTVRHGPEVRVVSPAVTTPRLRLPRHLLLRCVLILVSKVTSLYRAECGSKVDAQVTIASTVATALST